MLHALRLALCLFLLLGASPAAFAANIDAAEMADDIGIRRDRAANYHQTSKGVGRSYFAMSEAITRVRCDCAEMIDLAKYLEEDEKNEK